MKEDQNTFGYQGKTESATVVYPLLLNYGLSAVGVDSFKCPVNIRGGNWLPSPIAAQLVSFRLFFYQTGIGPSLILFKQPTNL